MFAESNECTTQQVQSLACYDILSHIIKKRRRPLTPKNKPPTIDEHMCIKFV